VKGDFFFYCKGGEKVHFCLEMKEMKIAVVLTVLIKAGAEEILCCLFFFSEGIDDP